MPPLNYRTILPKDLDPTKDPTLNELNDRFKELYDGINSALGYRGPVKLANTLDLNGNRISNVGAAEETTDVLTQEAADPLYSASTVQTQMNALGNYVVQTTRQLNNGVQQHKISSDLNAQGSIPPSNITGTLGWTTGTTTMTATWTSVIIQLADQSYVAVPNGSLTVTGLTNGSQYDFFPYYDTNLGILSFVAISGGSGAPAVAVPSSGFPALTTAALQQQTSDQRIALTAAASDMQITIGGSPGAATLRTRT